MLTQIVKTYSIAKKNEIKNRNGLDVAYTQVSDPNAKKTVRSTVVQDVFGTTKLFTGGRGDFGTSDFTFGGGSPGLTTLKVAPGCSF